MRADGRPHAVPITHAIVDGTIVFAIDHKPKSGGPLQRLTNIRRDPRVSVLFDHRSERWDELWWVRADGIGRVHDARPQEAATLEDRYPQYRSRAPVGPWVTIEVETWTGWTANAGRV